METPTEKAATGTPVGLTPMTAPEAARNVSLTLHAAMAHARNMPPAEAGDLCIEIAREWRHLAIALAQHQAMTPRPKDDDR